MIASKMDGEHIIEVNDLVNHMARTRSEEQAKFPLLHKIRRVPCDADNDVYEPIVVSIGPYHHKAMGTLEMEQTKWESLGYILQLNNERKMRDYLEAVAQVEQRIRSCYASQISIGSDEFVKMTLLDGCFMLCIYYGTTQATPAMNNVLSTDEQNVRLEQDIYDPVNIKDDVCHSKHWYTTVWTHDLVLLENQIPFFVAVKLFEVVTGGNIPITVLLENVARFVDDLLRLYPKANCKFDQPKELHHLLHMCHRYFKPNKIQVESNSHFGTYDDVGEQSVKSLGWHRALEYYKAGIEFKKREICSEFPHSLLDIVFYDGVMEIPCLTIDPDTHCLFRNLIAFEETCPQFGNYMTSYVVFLSQLITMPEDVCLLTKRGIIVDQLDGGAGVSHLFMKLAQGVTFDFNGEYYLKHIFHAMEMHYQMERPRWREWLGSIGSKLRSGPHESKPNHDYVRRSYDECV